jgi:Flp pilus assembly pilin Flp
MKMDLPAIGAGPEFSPGPWPTRPNKISQSASTTWLWHRGCNLSLKTTEIDPRRSNIVRIEKRTTVVSAIRRMFAHQAGMTSIEYGMVAFLISLVVLASAPLIGADIGKDISGVLVGLK